MKKLFHFIIAIGFLIACNNSSNTSTSTDSATTNTTNVENVNGNVPDTTSGMTLNQSLPVDSSRLKDSLKKH
jgi:acid phosphatase class B